MKKLTKEQIAEKATHQGAGGSVRVCKICCREIVVEGRRVKE